MEEVSVVLATHKGLGSVKLCGCNTIHLSIGPITVAVAPEAFAQTATMIRDAMEQLREIIEARNAEPATSATPTPGIHQWTHRSNMLYGQGCGSGKETASLPLPTLRTGHDSFPSSGSSRV